MEKGGGGDGEVLDSIEPCNNFSGWSTSMALSLLAVRQSTIPVHPSLPLSPPNFKMSPVPLIPLEPLALGRLSSSSRSLLPLLSLFSIPLLLPSPCPDLRSANWDFSLNYWSTAKFLALGMDALRTLWPALTQPDVASGGKPFKADFLVTSSINYAYEVFAGALQIPIHAVSVFPTA